MPMEAVASLACLKCRKDKRKCDRRTPNCSLCVSKRLKCDYSGRRKKRVVVTSIDLALDRGRLEPVPETSPAPCQPATLPSAAAARSSSHSSSLAAIYFIDGAAFRRSRLALQPSEMHCNRAVTEGVGTTSSLRTTAGIFFERIHIWMPIVSKSRFYQHLLHPLAQQHAELYLLVLCMRLVSSSWPSADNETYQTAKHLYSEAIAARILSVSVLQAGILLALYEVGHAIYPAGFLSVGACVQYGLAIDVDKSISNSEVSPLLWDEVEERRRVWWAVLVLDRFVHFGNPQRPLATTDPDLDSYLPVDDAAWDNGSSKPEDAMRISSESNLHMGRFTLLAQSVRLLSCTLEHVARYRSDEDLREDDGEIQLRRTLLALVNVYSIEESERRLEFCTQSAICYSAILMLEMMHTSTPSHLEGGRPFYTLQGVSTEAEAVLQAVNAMLPRLLGTPSQRYAALDYTSPFVLHVIYLAATIHLNLHRTKPSSSHKEKYTALRDTLGALSHRWKSAGTYLDILDATLMTSDPQT